MLDFTANIRKTQPTLAQPKKKTISYMTLDALIIGGITFFSTLAGARVVDYQTAGIAAGLSFFIQFAIERGIRK